jgi:replication-associated recombination protein RarA
MNESISEIRRLLQEIVEHLSSGSKADARKAVTKLERIAALASTSALTIQVRH